jgi:hypothetical protein
VVTRTIDGALVVAAFVPTLVALARSIQFVALAWRQDQVGIIFLGRNWEAESERGHGHNAFNEGHVWARRRCLLA